MASSLKAQHRHADERVDDIGFPQSIMRPPAPLFRNKASQLTMHKQLERRDLRAVPDENENEVDVVVTRLYQMVRNSPTQVPSGKVKVPGWSRIRKPG